MEEKKGMESCRGPPGGIRLRRNKRKDERYGKKTHAERQPAAPVLAHLHPQAEVSDGPRLHPPRGHGPGHLPVPCPVGGRGEIQAPHGGGAWLSWGAGGAVQLPPSAQAQAQAGAGLSPHPGELPTLPAVAGPALGGRAGRPAHPAGRGTAGPHPPDPPPLGQAGEAPGSPGGAVPVLPQRGAPPFFGHPGAPAKLPGAAAPVFGPARVNGQGRGRARSLGFWLFPLAFFRRRNPDNFLYFSAKCDKVTLSYSRQEALLWRSFLLF